MKKLLKQFGVVYLTFIYIFLFGLFCLPVVDMKDLYRGLGILFLFISAPFLIYLQNKFFTL